MRAFLKFIHFLILSSKSLFSLNITKGYLLKYIRCSNVFTCSIKLSFSNMVTWSVWSASAAVGLKLTILTITLPYLPYFDGNFYQHQLLEIQEWGIHPSLLIYSVWIEQQLFVHCQFYLHLYLRVFQWLLLHVSNVALLTWLTQSVISPGEGTDQSLKLLSNRICANIFQEQTC